MGWLVQDRPLTRETPAQYLRREYAFEGEAERHEVLDAAQVGRAVYMAIRRTMKAGPEAGRSCVFCAVILVFNNRRRGFGRKSMSEASGPCEVDCPARIFRLLSPVADIPNPGNAAEWRARVIARRQDRRVTADALKRLRAGERVRLTQPISFYDGRVLADEFELVPTPPRHRGPIFRPVGHDFLCRLPREQLGDALARMAKAAAGRSGSAP